MMLLAESSETVVRVNRWRGLCQRRVYITLSACVSAANHSATLCSVTQGLGFGERMSLLPAGSFQMLIMEAEEGNTRQGRKTCSFLFILFLFYALYLSCRCSFQFPVFLHTQNSHRGTCTSWPWHFHVALVIALRDPFSKLLGSYSPQALPSVPLATFHSQDFCDKFSIPFYIFSVLQYLFN